MHTLPISMELTRSIARGGACLATTLSFWVGLDAQTALAPPAHADALLYRWLHRWARTQLRILAVRLLAHGPYVARGESYPGRSATGRGRLFVMNHRSAVDILVTFAAAQAHLVSRHDLAQWPVIGAGARRLGTLFVDRSSLRSGANVLELMAQQLQDGRGVAIYPEGTAYAGDIVRPFKPGSFRAAKRVGAEIVPMGVAYADEAAYYGDESFAAHIARVIALPRLRVSLVVGDPIAVDGRSHTDAAEGARAAVQTLVHEARRRLG